MKRKLVLLSVIIIMSLLTSCAKCIDVEYKNVEVNIVDKYHRGAYSTPIMVGKVISMRTHPAVYKITVEYNGIKYTISGSDTYNRYKDKVGQVANGTLGIRTYDDGTIKHNIISLE